MGTAEVGELAEFSKGSGYAKNDLTESGSPIVLYGRLYTKYETIINDVDTFVEMKDNSVISEGNEVVVPASGETAEDISRASVMVYHACYTAQYKSNMRLCANTRSNFLAKPSFSYAFKILIGIDLIPFGVAGRAGNGVGYLKSCSFFASK